VHAGFAAEETEGELTRDGEGCGLDTGLVAVLDLVDLDFEALALQNHLKILDQFGLQEGQEIRFLPNARASRAVFKFQKS